MIETEGEHNFQLRVTRDQVKPTVGPAVALHITVRFTKT